MRILHLATQGSGTGVAMAVVRLHEALKNLGHESIVLALDLPHGSADPTIRAYQASRSLLSRIRRRIRRFQIERALARYEKTRDRDAESFRDDRAPFGRELVHRLPECDVITVHAMGRFLDYRSFFAEAPKRAPIVRVLHDMKFFTGGCHYDGGCGRYVDRCGRCPQLGSQREVDLSRRSWERKRAALSQVASGRLHLIAPSRWLAAEARRSSLLRGIPITFIPNGIDTQVFSPKDRRFCREVLGLPLDAPIALFVAEPLARRQKGFIELAEALARVEGRRELLLLTVGSGSPPVSVPVRHVRYGHVSDDRLLPMLYSAADMFVIPSRQDNCPQTAIEAIACGTPVVGFSTGGIPDIVRPWVTGLLAPPGDVAALAEAMDALFGDRVRLEEMRARCRQIAVTEYDTRIQADRYSRLYGAILAGQIPLPFYGPAESALTMAAVRVPER